MIKDMNCIIIRSYYYDDRVYTPEEYIKFRLLQSPNHIKYYNPLAKNAGLTKADLKNIAKNQYGISKIKSSATKENVLDLILMKEDIYTLANKFKIGVRWTQYAEVFNLTKNQIVKLGEVGFLKEIDKNISFKYKDENLYDIKQFSEMTKEMIDKVIEKFNISAGKDDMRLEYIVGNFELNKELINIRNDDRFKFIEEFAEYPEETMKRIRKES